MLMHMLIPSENYTVFVYLSSFVSIGTACVHISVNHFVFFSCFLFLHSTYCNVFAFCLLLLLLKLLFLLLAFCTALCKTCFVKCAL